MSYFLDFEVLVARLKIAGIENPWREARLLVSSALKCSYAEVLALRKISLSKSAIDHVEHMILRRCAREPLTKITGIASFWKYSFITNQDTLDPRPESEVIIETVLNYLQDKTAKLHFLDIGTGTGCLLISCLKEYPNSTGLGIDLSKKAIAVAQKNAVILEVADRATFIAKNWNDDVRGVFDVILCNPPYIKEDEKLSQEVLCDPKKALFGGKDGLSAYREIFPKIRENIRPLLKPISSSKFEGVSKLNPLLFFEIGKGQSNEVKKIAKKNGFFCYGFSKDLQKTLRVIVLHSKEKTK
ncbi:MAG: peptide chain release factor N(5)-glutamine methyltransferase [Holosporales bacterium]|nr:peptide chain release factor N(5)-glutamine methyltransferase [Holosporales bacterium]